MPTTAGFPCGCFPWNEIGEQVLEDFRRYTTWLSKRGRHPNERYPSEALFRHGMAHWLLNQGERFEFMNMESGYLEAGTNQPYYPKCDLQFAIDGQEHWIEFKAGPGPGNKKYKTSPSEWVGNWNRDVEKLSGPGYISGTGRHVLSFGLAKHGEDYDRSPFYHQVHQLVSLKVRFCSLGNVAWWPGTDMELDHLYMAVICVAPAAKANQS